MHKRQQMFHALRGISAKEKQICIKLGERKMGKRIVSKNTKMVHSKIKRGLGTKLMSYPHLPTIPI